MKRIVLALLIATAALMGGQSAFAQDNDTTSTDEAVSTQMTTVQYCLSYDDYVAGNWQTAGPIEVTTYSRARQFWWGGRDFRFQSSDKATEKLLKKKAFAIVYDNTLLLNTRSLKDRGTRFRSGYAHALPTTDGRFVLLYYNVNDLNMQVAMGGGFFGMAGALTVGVLNNENMKSDVCYFVTPGQKKALIVNDKMMNQMLTDANRPDLQSQYMQYPSKNDRISAYHVIPILEELGILQQK